MSFSNWIKRTSVACALFSAAIAAHAAPTLWVSTGGAQLATVDVATGTTSLIGSTGIALTDIAFSPTGDLYGISFSSLYTVNSSTGATTLVGGLGSVSGTANALVFGSDGTLYMAGSSLYSVNTLTGAASAIGSIGFQSGGDLAFIGGDLYMASNGNQLIGVDTATGAGTSIGNCGCREHVRSGNSRQREPLRRGRPERLLGRHDDGCSHDPVHVRPHSFWRRFWVGVPHRVPRRRLNGAGARHACAGGPGSSGGHGRAPAGCENRPLAL